jgi:hypothetical protein
MDDKLKTRIKEIMTSIAANEAEHVKIEAKIDDIRRKVSGSVASLDLAEERKKAALVLFASGKASEQEVRLIRDEIDSLKRKSVEEEEFVTALQERDAALAKELSPLKDEFLRQQRRFFLELSIDLIPSIRSLDHGQVHRLVALRRLSNAPVDDSPLLKEIFFPGGMNWDEINEISKAIMSEHFPTEEPNAEEENSTSFSGRLLHSITKNKKEAHNG